MDKEKLKKIIKQNNFELLDLQDISCIIKNIKKDIKKVKQDK